MRRLLLALLFAATPALAQEVVPTAIEAGVAQRAIEGYVRPSFERFAEQAGALETRMTALCGAPSGMSLADARQRFADMAGAYARIYFLRFGPLLRDNRMERLFLWPDPRGIALKQVQRVLAEQPDDVLDPVALQGKSVALQGINALEFVLFGTDSETLTAASGSYRCRYGASTAAAIRRVADDTRNEWADADGISRRLITPDVTDPDYRTVREVLEELVGAAAHGAEGARDIMLLPAIGQNGKKPNGRAAPLWRSDNSLAMVGGSLIGIVDFVRASGVTEAAGPVGPDIDETLALEAANVQRIETEVTGTIEEALADRQQMMSLRYLVIYSDQLETLIGGHLAQALGITVGFSALDRD
jgi:predicted lipoprotein